MAHPLELSYNWRTPAVVASIGAIGCAGVLFRGRTEGWLPVLLIVLVLWALLLLVLARRARSYLMVDDDVIVLRDRRGFARVAGDQVREVKQVPTARGASYRLLVEWPDGRSVRLLAPTAWLRDGHAVLFNWLHAYAPQARLDKGTRRMLDFLQQRGVIADAP